MINLISKLKLLWLLVILTVLNSCNQGGRSPIELEIISIEPDPIVGQVATVAFAVTSIYDVSATISTRLFDTAIGHYPDIEVFWEGTLTANESQEFLWTMCVLNPGRWRLDIGVESPEKYGDGQTRYIDSDFAHAEVAKYFEGPAKVTRLVTVFPIEDTPTFTSEENQVENITANSTMEPQILLSQECLEANSQP